MFILLLRVKEKKNILHEISKQKANCICHVLRRKCLLQTVIEEKIKGGITVTKKRGRSCRKLLDDLKEGRRCSDTTYVGESSRLHYVKSSLWTVLDLS
jgi:hypothetical protein